MNLNGPEPTAGGMIPTGRFGGQVGGQPLGRHCQQREQRRQWVRPYLAELAQHRDLPTRRAGQSH
jgi:hypothetical protein